MISYNEAISRSFLVIISNKILDQGIISNKILDRGIISNKILKL